MSRLMQRVMNPSVLGCGKDVQQYVMPRHKAVIITGDGVGKRTSRQRGKQGIGKIPQTIGRDGPVGEMGGDDVGKSFHFGVLFKTKP